MRNKWRTAGRPLVYAHRGVSSEFPENTIEAFAASRFRGADGVEMDARRLADGSIAVHHDPRLSDGRALVELGADELPPSVPLMKAALGACDGLVVNIELKNLPGEPDFDTTSELANLVVAEVTDLALQQNVLISSFNLASVNQVRDLDASLATAWLLADIDNLEHLLDQAVDGGHWAIHPPVSRTSRSLIDQAHDKGLRVNTWTVDDPIRMEQLLVDGVDGLITNVPDVARQKVTNFLTA